MLEAVRKCLSTSESMRELLVSYLCDLNARRKYRNPHLSE